MAAEAWLGALCVLELDDLHALNRVLAHTEKAGSDLRDDVVVVGLEPIVVTAFAGTGEGIPGHCGASLAENRVNAHRAERHPAAVNRQIDVHGRSPVITAIELQARVHFTCPNGLLMLGEDEAQLVEAATRFTMAILEAIFGRMPSLSHVPGRQNQIRSPARIPDGVHRRVALEGERLVRAIAHAIVVGLGALWTDAKVVRGTQRALVPGGLYMHALGTQLDALAAAFAVGRAS